MLTQRRAIVVAMVAGLTVWASQPVWAQDPIHKMGRGVVNALTGWIELPKQVHLGSQEANPLRGMGRGLIKGAELTILRSGLGVYEAVTFPLPYPKDFASPYEPMALDDYAWE